MVVDGVRAVVGMASKVELPNPFSGQRFEVVDGRKPMIFRIHIHIVHIDEQKRVSAFDHLSHELPLRKRARAVLDVARDVFEEQARTEQVLRLLHSVDDVTKRFLGVRQRPEIVGAMAAEAAKAKVVGDPRGLDRPSELSNALQVFVIQRIERADAQGDSVKHDVGVAPHAAEHRVRATAAIEEILGQGFD